MRTLQYIIILVVFPYVLFGQGICEGREVMVIEDGQCDNNPYVLVFEDNFDGSTLNLSKWMLQQWAQGSMKTEGVSQYYSLDNTTVADGILYITAKEETVVEKAVAWKEDTVILEDKLPNYPRTYNYTSSNIWTRRMFGYGKYEIRCKIPKGKGFWPAFWIFGESKIYNEIDIFEFWKNSTTDHNMTVHYDGLRCLTDYNGPDYSLDFHVFILVWNNYKMEWFVDGELKRKSTKYYTNLGQPLECNGIKALHSYLVDKTFPDTDSMYIIANLAIESGELAPNADTPFPSSFEIDYIRYYSKEVVDVEEEVNIEVYPNPSSGLFGIYIENIDEDEVSIKVFSSTGALLLRDKMNDFVYNLDISKHGIGMFMVSIEIKGKIYNRKIICQ